MIYHTKAPKTNYVICCWSGPRRFQDGRVRIDPCYYLRRQVERLTAMSHRLTRITLAISRNPHEPKVYRDYINSLKTINGAEVKIMDRHNFGMSYGAISDAFVKYKTDFEYYFQIEDDYLVSQHNFDQIHIDFLKNHPRCGFVCGVAGKHLSLPRMPYHAMVSNGCFRVESLVKLAANNGGVLWPCPYNAHIDSNSYTHSESFGQINMSVKMMELGWDVLDLGHQYKTGFRYPTGEIKWFYPQNPDVIYEPA